MKEVLMSDLYFNEESYYNEENTCNNEFFHFIFVHPFRREPGQKNSGNKSHGKETKQIHASVADLLSIRKGNSDWCKCGHCKNEAR